MHVCVSNALAEQRIHDTLADGCGPMRKARESHSVCACHSRRASCALDVLRAALRLTPPLRTASVSRCCAVA